MISRVEIDRAIWNFSLGKCFKENYTVVNELRKRTEEVPMGQGLHPKEKELSASSGNPVILRFTNRD
jgi:hypothetical protein